MRTLAWEPIGTEEPLDQHIDLGDGWWAGIGPDGREDYGAFSWSLHDHWLYDDAPPVAEGYASSEAAAKHAVMDAFNERTI